MMKQLNVPPDNHVKVLDGQGWVGLIDHLGQYAAVLDGDDEEALAYLLREGRLRKEELDGQK